MRKLFPRLNHQAVGLRKQDVAEPEHLIQGARLRKDLWVGGDANHTAQNLWSHTVTRVAVDHAAEPGRAGFMVGGIRSEGVDEYIDVGKNHGVSMTSSKSLDRLRSIPGRTPPEAFDTGNLTRSRLLAFRLARMSVRPSSISDVKVRPSSAARFLARRRRSSFILTVVLMH